MPQVPFFESFKWLDSGLNPALPDNWHSLGQYLEPSLVTWGTLQPLRLLLPRFSKRWWPKLDCEVTSSPDTLWELLTGFASMAKSTASESMVLGFIELTEVLATGTKLFQPSSYSTVTNCGLTFRKKKKKKNLAASNTIMG